MTVTATTISQDLQNLMEVKDKELEEMRVIAEMGGDLTPYKQRITALYWEVCRKHLRQCKCKNILKDAFIEIYTQLKRNTRTTNKKTMAQAKLVKGVVLFHEGQHYTNKNLTDDVARAFLVKFPQRKDWFEVLPSATTEKEVVAEVSDTAENGAEEASESEKVADKPTAPKTKKSAKKRK